MAIGRWQLAIGDDHTHGYDHGDNHDYGHNFAVSVPFAVANCQLPIANCHAIR